MWQAYYTVPRQFTCRGTLSCGDVFSTPWCSLQERCQLLIVCHQTDFPLKVTSMELKFPMPTRLTLLFWEIWVILWAAWHILDGMELGGVTWGSQTLMC